MEGAAYTLQIQPDPELEKQIDEIIDIIAEAQQDDGYLYVSHICKIARPREMGETPYSWVVHSHELYNMGHMYEGAIAYYRATGKDKWLKVAEKSARHIHKVFFEGDPNYNGGKPVNQAPGHQELELALCKLYRATANPLYLEMAKRFLDIRGVTYRPEGEGTMSPEYAQQHEPVRRQDRAVGHAVRAAYLYAGMADVAALTGDMSYTEALEKIWHNIVDAKMHITGGLGAVHGIEGFGPEYVLPNKDTYDETCAAVANVFFNFRMYLLHKDAKYFDVAEVALLNNSLAGVSLGGETFFYVNPLEADGVKRPPAPGQAGRVLYRRRGDYAVTRGSHASTSRIIPYAAMLEHRNHVQPPDVPADHYTNFIEACKGDAKANSPFCRGGAVTQVLNLGMICQYLNAELEFDPEKKRFLNNDAANAMLNPAPRTGWEEFYRMA